jgi:glucokinase
VSASDVRDRGRSGADEPGLRPELRTAIAVDIGGSGVRAARVALSGDTGPICRRPLARDMSRIELLERITSAVAETGADGHDAALAVAIPAFVGGRGLIQFCVNLPALDDVDLAALLGAVAPGGRVAVMPDVSAAAIAEALVGAGRDVHRFMCVPIGTGVNAAMTVAGRLLETVAGCLGDAGHVLVDPEGPRCGCGGTGCLEAIASGTALARDGAPLGLTGGAAVVDAARHGNAAARAIVERAGRALGRAIATWSAMLWPDRVAIAGGLSAAGDLLLEPARHELRRVGVPYLTGSVEIVPAMLGPDAALVGAGLAALTGFE